MEKFGKSQSVTRKEDLRLLTGHGRYVDDIAPADALHAYFLRSTVAHGKITALDLDDARDMPGVHMICTIDDLEAAGVKIGLGSVTVKNRDGSRGAAPLRPLLAKERVCHVGEAVAMIVADSMEQAKDAAEMIMLDIDDLPVHVDLAIGGEAIHPEAPHNLAFDWGLGDEAAVQAAIKDAAHVVTVDVFDNRVIVNSLEARGCYAEMEDGRLHLAFGGQGVWGIKDDLCKHLGMDAADVHVTTPDVGGGFGMKGMRYPEYFCVAHACRVLGRPVRWMSDRTEAMLSDNAGRDLTTEATLAFDANYRITAYSIDTIANMGAYNSQFAQPIQTDLFSKVMMGTYDVQTAYMRTRGIFTNTTPVDAYRGAGRPEAIFVLERVMDEAARQLGVDPWSLREKNFIAPAKFPYTTVSNVTYDVGDFAKVLASAAREADRDGFAARKAASNAEGKLRGQGLCYYIESILGDPSETTRVDFVDGGAKIFVGTQSNGQGHETVYAQFLADQTGIPADQIEVIQGDSDLIPTGGGTGGSRSVTVQNTATLATVDVILESFSAFLADAEGVDASAVSFDDERFRIAGSNLTPTMLDVADMAREAGRDDLLSQSARITLDNRSFPNGAHVTEVEIDPDTGVVTVDRYTVVDDFGNLINPMLAEGQVHGGVAQGLGQALTEQVVFDADGQLLTASFMDYGMPRADNLPMISFSTECTPSLYNPMGMKGCGEAGTVGALAAISNAVVDALWDVGVRKVEMPFTPHRIWRAIESAKGDSAAA
ncbi:xanthine dehydrogenase family protein molybdopterin-binding subunit [Yoonia sediminilitoris]|uniref:Carbon-monoxide dehydrogenase large subunit n=1 Tax=Yoonia sediminilitoris TaxID=1286148 RepID=A0A2T6KJN3_9RHOB|nr:xanthine dehydrogenase family protein molybdopterin-binding subunit [Yoonia sediminilitoris]PUB16174.1 carbon-monoxide dehydrogenase large subunit [Yoonia sediminilitoris]RCW96523.1 carbon-monoxide dehydrogenase large subunit [Yoonia sediminilitoris]